MAQKVQILLVDDLDGSEADEAVTFGLDGSTYSIDLSSANAGKLRAALQFYIEHARKASTATRNAGAGSRAGRPRRRGAPGRAQDGHEAEVRQWARAEGLEVNPRGRVSHELRARWKAAQPR